MVYYIIIFPNDVKWNSFDSGAQCVARLKWFSTLARFTNQNNISDNNRVFATATIFI